jgi:hypothetical protein
MKKMLIAIIILLLIVIFLLLYCNCRKKCHICGDDKKSSDSCRTFCYDSTGELQGMIDFNDLVKMSRDYATDLGKKTITGTGKLDALSMVFDLKKIKTLIWQIEHNACVNHCPEKRLGIRFYYVKYPSNIGTPEAPHCFDGIGPDEKNKHALVMVPVYRDDNKKPWYDYNIWDKRPGCYWMFPQVAPKDSLYILFSASDGDGGDNHGGIGPPPERGTFPAIQQ